MKKQVFVINPEDYDSMNQVVEVMTESKVKLQVTIEKYSKPRNVGQNAYYWLLITIIADSIGYTKEQMHEAFKFEFLKVTDGKFTRIASTAKLSEAIFAKYLKRIKQFADEEGIRIPEEGDVPPELLEKYYKL